MKLLALIIGAALYCTNAIRVEAPKLHLKRYEVNHQDEESSSAATSTYPQVAPSSTEGDSDSDSDSSSSSSSGVTDHSG